MGGRSSPPDFRFFCRKIPQNSSHVPLFLTPDFPRDIIKADGKTVRNCFTNIQKRLSCPELSLFFVLSDENTQVFYLSLRFLSSHLRTSSDITLAAMETTNGSRTTVRKIAKTFTSFRTMFGKRVAPTNFSISYPLALFHGLFDNK